MNTNKNKNDIPIPNTLTILLRTNIPQHPVLLYSPSISGITTSSSNNILYEPRIKLESDKIPIKDSKGDILLQLTQQQFFNIGNFDTLINRMPSNNVTATKESLLNAVDKKMIENNIKYTITTLFPTTESKSDPVIKKLNPVITIGSEIYTVDSTYYQTDSWVVRPKTGIDSKKKEVAEKQFELLQTIDPKLVNGPSSGRTDFTDASTMAGISQDVSVKRNIMMGPPGPTGPQGPPGLNATQISSTTSVPSTTSKINSIEANNVKPINENLKENNGCTNNVRKIFSGLYDLYKCLTTNSIDVESYKTQIKSVRVVQMTGNGDCLFQCVATALKDTSVTIQSLRSDFAEYFVKNINNYNVLLNTAVTTATEMNEEYKNKSNNLISEITYSNTINMSLANDIMSQNRGSFVVKSNNPFDDFPFVALKPNETEGIKDYIKSTDYWAGEEFLNYLFSVKNIYVVVFYADSTNPFTPSRVPKQMDDNTKIMYVYYKDNHYDLITMSAYSSFYNMTPNDSVVPNVGYFIKQYYTPPSFILTLAYLTSYKPGSTDYNFYPDKMKEMNANNTKNKCTDIYKSASVDLLGLDGGATDSDIDNLLKQNRYRNGYGYLPMYPPTYPPFGYYNNVSEMNRLDEQIEKARAEKNINALQQAQQYTGIAGPNKLLYKYNLDSSLLSYYIVVDLVLIKGDKPTKDDQNKIYCYKQYRNLMQAYNNLSNTTMYNTTKIGQKGGRKTYKRNYKRSKRKSAKRRYNK
jgi:hypothetical protein